MAVLSFKSVGRTAKSLQEEEVISAKFPIGIKTPLRLADIDGPFAMNYALEDQIADNLRNLLQTNFGERLGICDFGANLKPLTVDFSSQDNFDSQALERISSAIAKWMPFVDPIDYVSEIDRSQNLNTAVIRITISYNIPRLDVQQRKIQVVLYVI